MPEKILLIGLGLIGSSLALCIKDQFPQIKIYGHDLMKQSEKLAKQMGIIDEIAHHFDEVAQTSDLIILAVPVKTCIQQLEHLNTLTLKPEVLVTDVCSTKQLVVASGQTKKFDFIGGHPMAGSHKSGVMAADKNLFENAFYIFTPTREVNHKVAQLEQLFKGTRAKFIQLAPEEHDEITGMLSHFPHIVASGLVHQSHDLNNQYPRSRKLAAGGFRDITRIASADPRMWTDILLSNRHIMLDQIKHWQDLMAQIASWLNLEQEQAIFKFFKDAQVFRDQIPIHKKGAIPAFHDLLVDVPDTPGVIAEVTGLLGSQRISIINLRIHETREEISGIFQLSFKTERDLEAGKACIEAHTSYPCRLK